MVCLEESRGMGWAEGNGEVWHQFISLRLKNLDFIMLAAGSSGETCLYVVCNPDPCLPWKCIWEKGHHFTCAPEPAHAEAASPATLVPPRAASDPFAGHGPRPLNSCAPWRREPASARSSAEQCMLGPWPLFPQHCRRDWKDTSNSGQFGVMEGTGFTAGNLPLNMGRNPMICHS